ncbi:endothelin-converting enzyme 1-like [Actinia tenebrosa]|uniref:Endothelin-converting enzyme 1-like n=1 Tax=Actinia tenebrosa TaxID=6105 RepID=A0A6P8HK41_ACTTE|nr:endothelin-converting enzyme 1-like [Actinia tenebrosa]
MNRRHWRGRARMTGTNVRGHNGLAGAGDHKVLVDLIILSKKMSSCFVFQVEVNPLTYFENVQKHYQLNRKVILNLRGTKPKCQSWNMRYTTQNAQYTPSCNKIGVAVGLLQPPLYHSDFPSAINFGSIGMATGHEITHGFDASGAMYNKDGNVKLWWTKDTLQKFEKKTKCMEKQYSKFLVYGHHLNGKQTLNENIADNGGLRIAYEAYSKWLQTQGPDLTLPTISLTPKQLFFLSFSQTWCLKNTKSASIYALFTDEHSPSKARVNYVLSNMKEFSDAFKCAKGSPMNPEKKCIVW